MKMKLSTETKDALFGVRVSLAECAKYLGINEEKQENEKTNVIPLFGTETEEKVFGKVLQSFIKSFDKDEQFTKLIFVSHLLAGADVYGAYKHIETDYVKLSGNALDSLEHSIEALLEYAERTATDSEVLTPVERINRADYSVIFKGWSDRIPNETEEEKAFRRVIVSYIIAGAQSVNDYIHYKMDKKLM